MHAPSAEKIARVNARMAELLEEARKALRGESNFGVEEIQRLRQPLNEMAPVIANSSSLRKARPELDEPLNQYKSQLRELDSTLEQLRVMLLAKQATALSGHTHLNAVNRWLTTLRETS